MMRHRQRQAARQNGGAMAREIDVPLPLRGVFKEAKTSEFSGLYASELFNWRSNGFSLELRQAAALQQSTANATRRIPYTFGASPGLIRTKTSSLVGPNGAFASFQSDGKPAVAYISNRALIAGGIDHPITFDGTSFATSAFTTTTGQDPAEFDGVIAHQDRPFFWRTGVDLDFYYGEVGGITGALSQFPLSRLGNIEGSIQSMYSMTVDAGHGMNDVLVIFTTEGNIVAYEGLNPGDAQDWRQLNRLKIAPTISKHGFVQVGGDTWLLTSQGLVSAQDTMRSAKLALVNSVSRAVQKELVAQIKEGGEWQVHKSADASMVIINRVFNGVATQHILSTESDAWFTADYPAQFWHNIGTTTGFTAINGDLYNLTGADEQMTARWCSSWFRLPRAGGISYLIPTIKANGALTMTVTVLSDHDATGADIAEAVQTVTIKPDDPADPGGQVAINQEIAVDAVGSVFQIRIEVTAAWAELVNLKAALV